MSKQLASISIDLDSLWCYHEIHGLPKVEEQGIDLIHKFAMPRIFSLFSELEIPVTLFVVGRDVERHAQFLETAIKSGYELANHSFNHRYDLRNATKQVIRSDIRAGHKAIEAISGLAPLGFRTPGYNVSTSILSVLAELEYLYDSSVFPCPPYYGAKGAVMGWRKISGRKSRSAMALPQTLLAPITPYQASPRAFWKRSAQPTKTPVELPICTLPGLRFPIIGTSLHLISGWKFRTLFKALKIAHPDLLNLEFHAIDFVDSRDLEHPELERLQPDLKIPWQLKRRRYVEIIETIKSEYAFDTLAGATEQLDLEPQP